MGWQTESSLCQASQLLRVWKGGGRAAAASSSRREESKDPTRRNEEATRKKLREDETSLENIHLPSDSEKITGRWKADRWNSCTRVQEDEDDCMRCGFAGVWLSHLWLSRQSKLLEDIQLFFSSSASPTSDLGETGWRLA